MYTQEELNAVSARLRTRWLIVILPCAIMLASAIAVFVTGRQSLVDKQSRDESYWAISTAITILGGGLFLFFYGVYVRPMRLYRKHIDIMLNGRRRETTGLFKSFSDDISDKEGLDCHAMLINVGDKDKDEDDRLFYYDAHKPKPDIPLGTLITVVSNDRMVSDIKIA